MDKKNTPQKPALIEPSFRQYSAKADPNDLLQAFLKENDLVLTVDAIADKNSYIKGSGFLLTDKPMLVVSVKYKI